MAGYKIVYNGGSAEIVEKKSRFIANVFPLGSEEEAAGILEGIKKNTGMQDTTVMHMLQAG